MLDELSQLPQPEIGKLVYKLRRQLNLTQQELSQQLCVSFATVNRWERGKNKPSGMALKLIASQLLALGEAGINLLQPPVDS